MVPMMLLHTTIDIISVHIIVMIFLAEIVVIYIKVDGGTMHVLMSI